MQDELSDWVHSFHQRHPEEVAYFSQELFYAAGGRDEGGLEFSTFLNFVQHCEDLEDSTMYRVCNMICATQVNHCLILVCA